MAIVELSPAFTRLSGRSGNLVYRQTNGTTVLASLPSLPKRRRASAAQLQQRERFSQARFYAHTVLADAWQRRLYEQLAKARSQRAEQLAMRDFLTPPTVDEIDASTYQRRAGGLIRVLASDDIEVVSVEVAIHTAAGVLVERGPAECDHGVWRYRTAQSAPSDADLMLTATAQDRPGHPGSAALRLPATAPAA